MPATFTPGDFFSPPIFGTLGVNPGGPINATTTLSRFAYKIALERCDFGLASAVGTIWLVLLAAFAAMLGLRKQLPRFWAMAL